MNSFPRFLTALFLGLLCVASLQAQFRFQEKAQYDAHIKTPAEFLGYLPGERFTPHHRIEDYARYLSQVSERVQVQQYGETYEGRPLILLVISSPGHIRTLDRIRAGHAALRTGKVHDQQDMLKTLPAVAWLSYGVHGNESSSAEAALQVAWNLAAGQDSLTRALLTNLVVIIDPLLNPDGRERYVNWFRSVVGNKANPDPNSLEHIEPWPGGRGNHYYFDLNRDWAWATQQETRARLSVYQQWYPQLHVDFHEMGANSSYFFFPPQGPVLQDLPESTLKWMRRYGEANARAFDRRGWAYYTAENFDLFYPGYGDSWPSINGAIGMTYEQAGHGAAGTVFRRKDGTLLTLAERIEHHFVSSMATLAVTAEKRRERLQDYAAFWQQEKKADFAGYLLQSKISPARLKALVETLRRQDIEVQQVAEKRSITATRHVVDGSRNKIRISPQDYFIPIQQQNSRQLRILFKPNPVLSDTFFYDITSWSMPAAFGVQAYKVKKPPRTRKKQTPPEPQRSPSESRPYAWLLPWDDVPSAGFLSDVLEQNIRCYATRKTIQLAGRTFRPGAIIIPRWANAEVEDLSARIARLSEKWQVLPYYIETGLTLKGPDLGSSNNVAWIPNPKTAVLTGEGISSTSYGAIWFLFDRKIDMPFAALTPAVFSRIDLNRYKTIILPDARRSWSAMLDSTALKKLHNWVRNGGRLVAIGSAAGFLAQKKTGMTRISLRKKADKDTSAAEKKKKEEKKAQRTWAEKQHHKMLDRVSGAVFRMRVDTTHPLGFGQEEHIFTLKRGKRAFNLTGAGHHVGIYQKDARVAGYISKENRDLLRDASGIAVDRQGRGVIILFADDPNFRMFWRVTTGLFLNAVFFGSMM